MDSFVMNGYLWNIRLVRPTSPLLVDRTGVLTLGVTDPYTHTVYLSNSLREPLRTRVLIHELGHCALVSYGLIDDIHSLVPRNHWIDVEEFVCNFIADYGLRMLQIADDWRYIPNQLENLLA